MGTANELNNKMKRSLGKKSFFLVFLLIFIMGVAAIISGYCLYASTVQHEYKSMTCTLAGIEAKTLESDDAMDKLKEIVDVYASIPDEERGDGYSEEYQAHFTPLIDEEFREIQSTMWETQQENDALNSYVAAIDTKNGKMIYVIDADPREASFCYPGTWDDYPPELMSDLANGKKPGFIAKLLGFNEPQQAVLAPYRDKGVRCTGGVTLFKTDQYNVMAIVDNDLDAIVDISKTYLIMFGMFLLIISALMAGLVLQQTRKNIVKPINEMAGAATKYSEDRVAGRRGQKHFSKLDIQTGDEIENLANTMTEMESDIAAYVEDLTRITAETERINTELSIAAQIQDASMPNAFPLFPDRREFDLYASVSPAKEVGGDFYDCFLIDKDHLAILIADVSGKGVPAALFMMASKIVISDFTRITKTSPAMILEAVNNNICAKNYLEMFLTVWLGILEISTGKLTAVNAGHEYPAIKRADGTFELMKDKHSFIVGGLPDIQYKEYEIQLEPGDIIFEYTDGVTEATTAENQLFGTDRMIEALNKDDSSDPKEIVQGIYESIDAFVKDAPQFDDITMICMKYNGSDTKE